MNIQERDPKKEWEDWWKKWALSLEMYWRDGCNPHQRLSSLQFPRLIWFSKKFLFEFSRASLSVKKVPAIVTVMVEDLSAWSFKDTTYDGYLTRLAAHGRCIVVAVNYRPAHDKPYPGPFDDCYKVTTLAGNGKISGVPAGKLLVAGDSSGSNLAFAVAPKAERQRRIH